MVRYNKKGDVWQGYILALILGLLVLGLSLYFIFNEYFTQDDLEWEQCRQSVILRNLAPEKDTLAGVVSSKGILPLKCGTKTILIDYEDVDRAKKEVADAISSCWYILGEGNYKIFPGSSYGFVAADTPCMVCARIHMTEKAKEYYVGDKTIDIESALNGPFHGASKTYWQYLNPSSGKKAFMYFKSWWNGGFWASEYSKTFTSGLSDEVQSFNLPRYFYPSRGDLFVVYAEPILEASWSAERGAKPYMVLVQEKDFDNLAKVWAKYEVSLKSKVCSSIETVPS